MWIFCYYVLCGCVHVVCIGGKQPGTRTQHLPMHSLLGWYAGKAVELRLVGPFELPRFSVHLYMVYNILILIDLLNTIITNQMCCPYFTSKWCGSTWSIEKKQNCISWPFQFITKNKRNCKQCASTWNGNTIITNQIVPWPFQFCKPLRLRRNKISES